MEIFGRVGGGGEQHLVVERKIPQLRIVFQRGGDEVFAGDEHHHIVRRIIELALITLGAERLDVLPHRSRVQIEMVFARRIIRRLERGLIGVQ